MKRKIFSFMGVFLETIFAIFFITLSIMFLFASVKNIMIQTEVKRFVDSAVFESETENTVYYKVQTDDLEEESIGFQFFSTGEPMSPILGYDGDLFIMPQSRIETIPFSSSFISFLFGGHAGVVGREGDIIEAMGGTREDEYVERNFSDLYMEERTVIGLRVNLPLEEREKAVDYAYSLVGKKYNYAFVFDTKDKYYCTDLCSRIYGKESGLNYAIDANGFYTTTQELFMSRKTRITYVKVVRDDKCYIYYLSKD